MGNKDELTKAQQRVAAKRERDRAAREAGASSSTRAQAAAAMSPAHARPSARQTAPPLLLSHADLREHYGISYSKESLRRLMAAGKFPAALAFGPEAYARKAWNRDDIEAWVKGLRKFRYSAPRAA